MILAIVAIAFLILVLTDGGKGSMPEPLPTTEVSYESP